MLKVNNISTRKRCKICSELTIKTPERRQWRRSCVFIVNFEYISHVFSRVSIVNFKQVNVSWVENSNLQVLELALELKIVCFVVSVNPVNIYLFKFNNRNTRKWREIFSKLTIKIPERRQGCRSCVFIVNFEHISRLFLLFLLLNLNE